MTTKFDRLDFLLPDFVRKAWTSDEARAVWEPRFYRITQAWFQIEWHAVLAGVRDCCVTITTPESFVTEAGEWAKHGLNALPVELQGVSNSSYASTASKAELGKPFVYRVVIGTPASVTKFKTAWDANDHHQIGALLGYPACCHQFFHDVWVEDGMVDTTWPMAVATVAGDVNGRSITLSGPPEANILWRWAGMRAVPHLPCQFNCETTVKLGKALIQVGRDIGYNEEMDWLMEILSWPVEWSALHGIAEIKTPLLKLSTRTDATPYKYTVRYQGTSYPAEGAQGLGFPYQLSRPPLISTSSAFKRGLDHPLPIMPVTSPPSWLATDNGFSSVAAMDNAHEPIVDLATAVIGENSATILELGCGNGRLLQKIQEATPNIVPYGCDIDAIKIEHAHHLRPGLTDNYVTANMFDANAPMWGDGRYYDLVILMPGRLLEVSEPEVATLKELLKKHSHQLLVYAYGDWLTRHQSFVNLVCKARLTLQSTHTSGVVAIATIS